jgi:Tfp pilus assembly protein PilX
MSHFRHRARQRGVVLIVALLVLVVTVLAAVALVRSVDVATLVSGNLAYRQAAAQAVDGGIEVARNWLMTRPNNTDLYARQAPFYFPSRNGGVIDPHVFDPTDELWLDFWADANNEVLYRELDKDAQGNTVRYVVHRMCENPGDPGNAFCFVAGGVAAEGISNRIKEPGDLPCFNPNTGQNLCTPTNPYYRITVKVSGPRGTATYAQAVIY